MSWFTTKRIGEIAVFPTGMRVRIVSIRGTKVRLEVLGTAAENKVPAPAARDQRSDRNSNGGRP